CPSAPGAACTSSWGRPSPSSPSGCWRCSCAGPSAPARAPVRAARLRRRRPTTVCSPGWPRCRAGSPRSRSGRFSPTPGSGPPCAARDRTAPTSWSSPRTPSGPAPSPPPFPVA
ncbi:MAG: hypothetical protein AVDCRST_MAG52-3137, partial [uncultured Blastococcus sp.]